MEEVEKISMILGRPFIATRGVLINVLEGKVPMRIEDELVTFGVLKSMDFHSIVKYCNKLNDLTSKLRMVEPSRTNPLVIAEPTKPPLDMFNAINPPPKGIL